MVKFIITPQLYAKDPESSALGKKIIGESIKLIEEVGFESFTFKKLGERIGSNESSLYRYFENKHKLLLYLSSWYWSWVEYKMRFATANIDDPFEKLKRALHVVADSVSDDETTQHVDEALLNKIIVAEFTKTFHTKEVDDENRKGFFLIYKKVIYLLASLIKDAAPGYAYPESLASNIIEGALHQHFLRGHFKTITSSHATPSEFYLDMVTALLERQSS